jgi:long-chain acyl-CoA synthetase
LNREEIIVAECEREAIRRAQTRGIEGWRNLVEMFLVQAGRLGAEPFLWRRADTGWAAISWNEAANEVARIAAALTSSGVRKGDRVVIVSENRPEFCLWDLGIMAAGGISVPTYTTNMVRDHLHILENSGAVAAMVSTDRLARPLIEAAYQSSHCRRIISLDPVRIGQAGETVEIVTASTFLAPHEGDPELLRKAAEGMSRDDTACLIYTSGTGGTPRGVMQHHGAILHNVAGCVDIIDNDFAESGRERFLSFLPASHAYEHTAGQYLPISVGGEIFYAESLEKLSANIEEIRPTIMVVVPRLFEVLRARMLKAIEKQGGLAPRMLAAAQDLGRVRRENGGRLPLARRPMDWLVDRTLRARVRTRFGGRLKAMVSGGAPLNPEVGLFFEALGVTILQGYGQTEAGPVISCNRPSAGIRMDSVGPPLKDVDIRIAEDGEILVAGELVMKGYWGNPEETARVLTPDGWLMTGDVGRLDEDGHIVITDRKKDIIVNDKGDNIAPQRVEGMLTLQPEIAQAMVHGDRRPHLVAVIVPDDEHAQAFAAREGVPVDHLHRNPEFLRSVQAAVDRVNAQLSVIEKVRRIILADEPFTVENEQMTPSLKIRRHVLKGLYGERLNALFR